jgi:CRP-like cAMP-binding protein
MNWKRQPDARLEALRALPELREVGDSRLAGLLRHFDELEVEPGSLLVRAGRPAAEALLVVEGRLEVTGAGGVASLGPGEAWGWRALAERGVHPATVVAGTRARLLVMGRAQYRALAGFGPPNPVEVTAPAFDRAS